MKKLLTIVSVALFGAVIGFACGGGQSPAGESTLPAAEEAAPVTPAADSTAPVEAVGGSAYGGGGYGASAYGGGAKAGW